MPVDDVARRHALLGAGALLLARAARAAPPQRNLSVQVRVSDEQADAQRSARGGVTIGSRGGRIDGGGAVVVQAGSSRQAGDAVQSVLVFNGARATLRLAQGLLLDDTELWWTPWGPGAAVRSQWIEWADGFEVRPLWPGGDAPVQLELAVQRSTPGAPAPAGMPATRGTLPAQWSVVSTVQAPLDEWVTVAEVHARQASSVGSGGFGAATSSRQRSLQLRVSLP